MNNIAHMMMLKASAAVKDHALKTLTTLSNDDALLIDLDDIDGYLTKDQTQVEQELQELAATAQKADAQFLYLY